mgnify:CR=1 FL=1
MQDTVKRTQVSLSFFVFAFSILSSLTPSYPILSLYPLPT